MYFTGKPFILCLVCMFNFLPVFINAQFINRPDSLMPVEMSIDEPINNYHPKPIIIQIAESLPGVKANVQDSLVLVELYNTTRAPKWKQNVPAGKAWLTGPVSNWYGIKLDTAGRVVSIVLTSGILMNTLPASLAKLEALRVFNVRGNFLHGDRLPPVTGLKNLEELNLSNNRFGGSIPEDIGNLTRLKILSLVDNNLKGTLPPSFFKLSQLSVFNIFMDHITGNIPSGFSNLTNLTRLVLGFNHFDGVFPVSLGKLHQLTELDVSNNTITGTLPDIFDGMPALQSFSASFNKLNGKIPASLARLKQLVKVEISFNYFGFDGMGDLVKAVPSARLTQYRFTLQFHNKMLDATVAGTPANNEYLWYKDYKVVKKVTGNATYRPEIPGYYTASVNNKSMPDITMLSEDILVTAAMIK